jgi:hypothetical protein
MNPKDLIFPKGDSQEEVLGREKLSNRSLA